MQTELDDRLPLIAYSMDEFLIKVQEGIKAGYELNYNNTNGYPRNYIGLYEITLFKPEVIAEEDIDSNPENVSKGTEGNSEVNINEVLKDSVFKDNPYEKPVQESKPVVGRPKKNKEGTNPSEA